MYKGQKTMHAFSQVRFFS